MPEYFDIIDENNLLTGEKRLRTEVHSLGLWHRTVHVYFFREIDNEIKFLVHLRAKKKDLNPNKWDTRLGGHIKSGQSIQEAIENEITDEVGLKLDPAELIKGEIYKGDKYPNREFYNVFYYRFEPDNYVLKFNDGEVQEVKWMKSLEITESMDKNPDIWSGSKDEFIKILDVLKIKLEMF